MTKIFRAKHNQDYIKNGVESDSARQARKDREADIFENAFPDLAESKSKLDGLELKFIKGE